MDETALKKVAATIKARRKSMGFTQESFAHHARLARTYYGRIEQGGQNLELKTLFVLASHLQIKPSELIADVTLDECDALVLGAGGKENRRAE